jgi:multimeric flavodoxin WrbA
VPTLLVVHHTISPGTQELLDAALAGAKADGIEGVTVVVRPALSATASDLLDADGFVLGTPANIGYMADRKCRRTSLPPTPRRPA